MPSCWMGVAVLIDVAVLAVDARRAAEHSYIGPRGPVGKEQERRADADEEPGERPEDGHPQQGGERGDEVGTRDPPELAAEALGVRVVEVDQDGHVDKLDDRGDHDGGQCCLGQVLEEPGEEEQRHNGEGARDQPESCVRAPAVAFTAVLERLPLTTMPLLRPEARLAPPSATSSRLTSICSLLRAA